MANFEPKDYRKRDEDTGQYYWTCPECDDSPRFNSLQGWKQHMQKEHGGYTVSEVEDSAPKPQEEQAGAVQRAGPAPAQSPKPKKISAKARELNDKFNRCISLCVKHMFKGLNELELAELEQLRGDVSEAVIGVEFDFEQKLVAVSGKWALVIALSLIYVLPHIPTLKDIIAKAKESAEKKKLEQK